MNEEESRGPVAPFPVNVRRGWKSKAEGEAWASQEAQGIRVAICETCGHIAGTNPDCVECSW